MEIDIENCNITVRFQYWLVSVGKCGCVCGSVWERKCLLEQYDVIRVSSPQQILVLGHTSLCLQTRSGFPLPPLRTLPKANLCREGKPLCPMPNDGRHSASPGPLFVRKFALVQGSLWLCLTLVTVSIPGNWFFMSESWALIMSFNRICIRAFVWIFSRLRCNCVLIFCLSLQPRGLPAVATQMSSSAEWTVCVFPCDGAVMETRTAWTSAMRRTARASHICVTLPSSSPARTRVSTGLAILNVSYTCR